MNKTVLIMLMVAGVSSQSAFAQDDYCRRYGCPAAANTAPGDSTTNSGSDSTQSAAQETVNKDGQEVKSQDQ